MPDGIDAYECLRRGAIGAVGAVPGTLAAHPCDVIKMKQQIGGGSLIATLKGLNGVSALYGGLSAGVLQKITTSEYRSITCRLEPLWNPIRIFLVYNRRRADVPHQRALHPASPARALIVT